MNISSQNQTIEDVARTLSTTPLVNVPDVVCCAPPKGVARNDVNGQGFEGDVVDEVARSTNNVKVCERCGGFDFEDIQIHDGQTVRRDCTFCGRTWGFPVWYGKSEQARIERCRLLLSGQLRGKVKRASELGFDYTKASAIARRRSGQP